jgi:hypothetical protein
MKMELELRWKMTENCHFFKMGSMEGIHTLKIPVLYYGDGVQWQFPLCTYFN